MKTSLGPYPYAGIVPLNPSENVDFRMMLLRKAATSKEMRKSLREMCARDTLFYTNAFVCTYSPKDHPDNNVQPFVTYDYQVEAMTELDKHLGYRDFLIEKSRDLGASWMTLIVFDKRLLFHQRQTFLAASYKEDMVDKKADPDSLFWKIDFIHRNLPKWLIGCDIERNALHIASPLTGGTIDGTSTTGNLSTGGRRVAIFLDEFSLVPNGEAVRGGTQHATECRIINGTPKGAGNNGLYVMSRAPGIRKLILHWSQHPTRRIGLYRLDERGEIVLLDADYWTQERVMTYPFVREIPMNPRFPFRSPWYDYQCSREPNKFLIAQELDIYYHGSSFEFFASSMMDEKEKLCTEPVVKGEMEIDLNRFVEKGGLPDQQVVLWTAPDVYSGRLPARHIGLAVDAGLGTGASNSVIHIGNLETGEKLGCLATCSIGPGRLAKIAVAIKKWLGAEMIWETNGSGRSFGEAVVELDSTGCYVDEDDDKIGGASKMRYGWAPTKSRKKALFEKHVERWRDGEYVTYDRMEIMEARNYQHDMSGGVSFGPSMDTEDPTGARDNHGDRVTAAALFTRLRETWMRKNGIERGKKPMTPHEEKIAEYAERLRKQREEAENTKYRYGESVSRY